MRYCGVILSFGDVPFIKKTIESMGNMDIFVINALKSWWSEKMKDKTSSRIKGYGNVKLVKADVKDQAHALNFAKEFCRGVGYEIMIILDSDEEIEDIEKLKEEISKKRQDAWACPIVEYTEDAKTPLIQRKHAPIVAIRCDDPLHSFYDKRCYNGDIMSVIQDIKIKHYSLANKKDAKFKKTKGYGEPMFSLEREIEWHK